MEVDRPDAVDQGLPGELLLVVPGPTEPDDGVRTHRTAQEHQLGFGGSARPLGDDLRHLGTARSVEHHAERARVGVSEQQDHCSLEVRIADQRRGHEQPPDVAGPVRHDPLIVGSWVAELASPDRAGSEAEQLSQHRGGGPPDRVADDVEEVDRSRRPEDLPALLVEDIVVHQLGQ